MLRLESVGKRFGSRWAVQDLSLEVGDGELCVLIGPSGCGKTTTLKMINRLVQPSAGRVYLDDEDVTHVDPVQLRRRMGYVIQQVGLFPHETVAGNVATVPHLLGWDRQRVRSRVDELLDLVGLEPAEYGGRYPDELSGGQRQRVGVARALAADPPVLLMDEPFGAIDPIARDRLQAEFLRLQGELRKTVVFVTHDIDEAVRLGDRIAVLHQGGVLEQYDTPAAILGRPASPFVADFVGQDRGLKRLSVTRIDAAALEPVPAQLPDDSDEVHARVALDGTLRDALAQLLLHDAPWVVVVDGERPVGVLTPDSLYGALRQSLAEDDRAHH
jgi:osmoprotectant transport system ATP-binding protein